MKSIKVSNTVTLDGKQHGIAKGVFKFPIVFTYKPFEEGSLLAPSDVQSSTPEMAEEYKDYFTQIALAIMLDVSLLNTLIEDSDRCFDLTLSEVKEYFDTSVEEAFGILIRREFTFIDSSKQTIIISSAQATAVVTVTKL
ncbi:MAG: hypothetical protein MJK10_19100 [Pseudomonadales bacterium]|nr:hypothetical protein [Pseudomonadales bacterium]NRA15241.1 hypothetical protein [Oceanospirillaceae bacterium]